MLRVRDATPCEPQPPVSAVAVGSSKPRLVWSCAVALAWIAALSRPVLADDARAPDDVPPGQSKFRVLAGADGLRNLVINSIAQDDNGFLWLGTEDGVYRFDGDRFTHYKLLDSVVQSTRDKDGHEQDLFDGIDTSVPGLAAGLGEKPKLRSISAIRGPSVASSSAAAR
jgi:hypothetical protein